MTADNNSLPNPDSVCKSERKKESANQHPDRFTFPKSERLRHKILVDSLFAQGKSLYEYPLRLVYRQLTDKQLEEAFRIGIPDKIAPLQVMITVPKKKRRHAVDRVLMRRRIREVYRLNRRPLRRIIEHHPELRTLSIAIIYLSDENLPSSRLQSKLQILLTKLSDELTKIPLQH